MDKRQQSLRFAWRMTKAFVFAFLGGGNFFCLYLVAKAITLGHMAETTVTEGVSWLGLVPVAIFFMCSLHEVVEGVGELRKKEDEPCAR